MNCLYFVILSLLVCSLPLLSQEADRVGKSMESTAERPKYLYKILSWRNWQASQSRKMVQLAAEDSIFIHLATENQLNKIISKYWSDESQYVILKLEMDKLEGKLVYETNPGGSTKYYHLYQGFIPFGAIVEAKVIFNNSQEACFSPTQDIVQIGHPVLRKKARALAKEEILSSEIQSLIQEMKATMRAAPGVGLAAPQIGKNLQLLVIEDIDHSHLTQQQLTERERYSVPFHVIINPKLYLDETEKTEFFEGCLSVPGVVAVVPRARSVRVEALNEHAEPIVIEASGWYARILQHEIDHVNGTLYIDRAHLSTLMTEENYLKFWKEKKIQEVLPN